MQFSKEDMDVDYYNWPEDQTFSGDASRRLFDRFNGQQVLFIINLFLAESSKRDKEDGKKTELLLMNTLPVEAKSELSVFNWLKKTAVALQKN